MPWRQCRQAYFRQVRIYRSNDSRRFISRTEAYRDGYKRNQQGENKRKQQVKPGKDKELVPSEEEKVQSIQEKEAEG
jgi:hypothetical protein